MPIENNKTYILSVRDRLNITGRSYIRFYILGIKRGLVTR
jgi:hypothetical protein